MSEKKNSKWVNRGDWLYIFTIIQIIFINLWMMIIPNDMIRTLCISLCYIKILIASFIRILIRVLLSGKPRFNPMLISIFILMDLVNYGIWAIYFYGVFQTLKGEFGLKSACIWIGVVLIILKGKWKSYARERIRKREERKVIEFETYLFNRK